MMSRYRDKSLSELVRAARSGRKAEHDDAFGEIVRRFRANAQASAYYLLRDAHLAQDVAQEAFIDAYLGLEGLRDPAAFPGWFRRIVFKHVDRIRRRPRLALVDLGAADEIPYESGGPEAEAAAREDTARVRRALEGLPEHECAVVVLFYFAQQSHAEIGDRLMVPVSTVKKRLHDARRRLQLPLEGTGDLPALFVPAPRPAALAEELQRAAASALADPVLHGDDALRLALLGTPDARQRLGRFTAPAVASALQELTAKEQLAFLEVSDRLPEIVPCLSEVALTQTILSVGLADAGWLVEFASPEQRIAAFDLDCWRDGRLSPNRLFQWIDALIEAGTETLLAAFDELDAEVWILALKQMADFEIPPRSDDPWDDEDFEIPDGLTEDGVVFYEPSSADHEERLREILRTALAYVPSLYWDFVYGCINESFRSCEEGAARWQPGRLNDLGFPDLEHAMGVYRPRSIDSLPRIESLSAPPATETSVPDLLSGTDLGRALAALPPERASEILDQVFALANAIAVADRLPLGVAAALEHCLGKALEGVDRGLAAVADARHRSLSEIADTHAPRDLFRVGVGVSPELHPRPSLGEFEEREADVDELDWDIPVEWLSDEDGTLDFDGRPR